MAIIRGEPHKPDEKYVKYDKSDLIKGREFKVHQQTHNRVNLTKFRIPLMHLVTGEEVDKNYRWEPKLSDHAISVKELKPHGQSVTAGTNVVVFCEGEGATDTVEAIMGSLTLKAQGLHGQTVPTGKVLKALYYDVSCFIFWPDADPPGIAAMEKLSQDLVEFLPEVKQGWVKIPPNAQVKDDAVQLATQVEELVTAAIESAEPTKRRNVEEVLAEEYNEEWPEPVPDEFFYGVLGRITRKLCAYSEADPHAVFMTAATAVPLFLGIQPNQPSPYHSTTRLYSLVVGRAGIGRKGTSWKLVEEFILKPLAERLGKQDTLKDALCSNISSGEGIPYRFKDPDSPRNQLFYVEEFKSVFTSMAREGSKTADYIKTGFDGGKLDVPTANNPIVAHGCHFGILGHISPKELRQSTKDIYSSNGFLRRWFFVASKKGKKFDDYLPQGIIDLELEDLAECISAAVLCGRVLMDDDAKSLISELKDEFEPKNDSFLSDIKSEATTPLLRLALVVALLDRKNHSKVMAGPVGIGHATPDPIRNDEQLIKLVHVKSALAWVRYSHESIQHVYGDRQFSRYGRKLLDYLEQTVGGELTQSDVYRKVFSGNLTSDDLKPIFRELLEAGVLMKQKEKSDKGPDTIIWKLKGIHSAG